MIRLNRRKKYCACGCGEEVKLKQKYIRGHNRRGKSSWNAGKSSWNAGIHKEKPVWLCACNCGEYGKPGRKFINGYNRKGINFVMAEEQKQKLRVPKSKLAKQNMKEAQNRPEVKAKRNITFNSILTKNKMSNSALIAGARPETKEKRSVAAKEIGSRHETKEKRSSYGKIPWEDRENMIALLTAARNRLEVKERNSKRMKKKWKEDIFVSKQMKARHVKQNKLEKKGEDLFHKLCPSEYKFTGDGDVVIAGKCPDFININGQKKIIEIYGDYWHRDDNEQDRIDTFAKYGYDTLIIWEREFKDIETLTKKITDFHTRENPYSIHKE